MRDDEIRNRIELESSGSRCGGCSGMGGVRRDDAGTVTGVFCKGHKGECVSVKGENCPKFIQLCPSKARAYLPVLASHTRAQLCEEMLPPRTPTNFSTTAVVFVQPQSLAA